LFIKNSGWALRNGLRAWKLATVYAPFNYQPLDCLGKSQNTIPTKASQAGE